MVVKLLIFVGSMLFLIGCAERYIKPPIQDPEITIIEEIVISQASFDHDCAENDTKIIFKNNELWLYKLKICGKVYKYRVFSPSSYEYIAMDITHKGR